MPKHQDDNHPATKADVQRSQDELATMIAQSFKTVATKADLKQFATKDDLKSMEGRLVNKFATKKDMSAVEKRLDHLESGQSAILKVVESIDEQLKEHRTLPTRVARLERATFH